MQFTKQQIKRANKLLDELCKHRDLGAEQVYAIFDSKREAEDICTILQKKELLFAMWAEGHEIVVLRSNENTRIAVETNLLVKEFKKDKKSAFLTNLTLISLIVSVVLNIGLIGSRFLKSDDSSKSKANLDACMIRESKLNHAVDSLSVQNHNLQDKATKLETEIVQLKQKIQN